MPAQSATTVQKTFKDEVYTIFARATITGASDPVLITANGASKGIASITFLATPSRYVVTLDRASIPEKAFIGTPIITYIQSTTTAGQIIISRVTVEDTTAGTFTIAGYHGVGATTNYPTGGTLCITVPITCNLVT